MASLVSVDLKGYLYTASSTGHRVGASDLGVQKCRVSCAHIPASQESLMLGDEAKAATSSYAVPRGCRRVRIQAFVRNAVVATESGLSTYGWPAFLHVACFFAPPADQRIEIHGGRHAALGPVCRLFGPVHEAFVITPFLPPECPIAHDTPVRCPLLLSGVKWRPRAREDPCSGTN